MKKLLSITLALALIATVACNPATVTTAENYVNTLLPYVEAAANIIIATEAPGVGALATTVEQAVNAGVQQIEALISAATASNVTTTRQQIVAIADNLKSQLTGLMTTAQIKNTKTQTEVTAFVTAADSLIDELANVIPPTQTTALSAEQKVKVATITANYKHRYNTLVNTKTGDPTIDAQLAKAKRFRHWYGKSY